MQYFYSQSRRTRYGVFNKERGSGPIAGPGNFFDDWPSLRQAELGFEDIIQTTLLLLSRTSYPHGSSHFGDLFG
jgi:hypothetical protein